MPCPSPRNLPDRGVEPRSPALQTDSLPFEPPGKPIIYSPVWQPQSAPLTSTGPASSLGGVSPLQKFSSQYAVPKANRVTLGVPLTQSLCATAWGAALVARTVRNQPAKQETQVRSPGWEDPLEKGMFTHSSILAWRIPRTEEPGELHSYIALQAPLSMGSQRVRHDEATNTQQPPLLHLLPNVLGLKQILHHCALHSSVW